MNSAEAIGKSNFFARSYLLLFLISLVSLAATFLVSNADLIYSAKLAVFVSIVFGYLFSCAAIYIRAAKKTPSSAVEENEDSPFDREIEAKLLALEDVHRFFSASLKSDDMFRLIASRVNEIVPFTDCAVFLPDKAGGDEPLKIKYASGEELKKLIGLENIASANLAERCFHTESLQIENKFDARAKNKSAVPFEKYQSAIAVPLKRDGTIFGVFALYNETALAFDRKSQTLFEAVAARVAPLLYSSRTFDENLNNALTDALTNLPNERGFFLVLENQIAESQRSRDRRLAILAIDIKNFGELNQRFGHATGDRLLIFAAETIKKQLRRMDLLTRSVGDEFLVILPTASDEITIEIVGRVERAFTLSPFSAANDEPVHLQLNFGAASFGRNGETADALLKYALLQKQQSKLKAGDGKILWFPKEYVN